MTALLSGCDAGTVSVVPADPGWPHVFRADFMAGHPRGDSPEPYVAVLVAAGYELRGPQGVPDRLLFVLGPEAKRTHHLNLVEAGCGFWRDHLLFRDRLRAEPALAAEYARLKQELAARHPAERGVYTNGKVDFVRAAIR